MVVINSPFKAYSSTCTSKRDTETRAWWEMGAVGPTPPQEVKSGFYARRLVKYSRVYGLDRADCTQTHALRVYPRQVMPVLAPQCPLLGRG